MVRLVRTRLLCTGCSLQAEYEVRFIDLETNQLTGEVRNTLKGPSKSMAGRRHTRML